MSKKQKVPEGSKRVKLKLAIGEREAYLTSTGDLLIPVQDGEKLQKSAPLGKMIRENKGIVDLG